MNLLKNQNGAGESFGASATHFGLVEGLIMRGN